MRSPSARILVNAVDIYTAITGQDADAAYQPTYGPPAQSCVPCSVQQRDVEEVFDDQNRLTQRLTYHVFFPTDPHVRPRDKLLWRDSCGRIRTLIVQATRNEAGRDSTFVVRTIERI